MWCEVFKKIAAFCDEISIDLALIIGVKIYLDLPLDQCDSPKKGEIRYISSGTLIMSNSL
jgi:hypothetical protein